MNEVNYKQGMTTAWSDGEKLVIKNKSGRQHIKANIEQIFGMGEYDKILEVKYFEDSRRGRINPHSRSIEIVSADIPKRVKLDLEKKSLPGIKDEDLMEKYFE